LAALDKSEGPFWVDLRRSRVTGRWPAAFGQKSPFVLRHPACASTCHPESATL